MFYRYEHYMSISHMALIVAMEHIVIKNAHSDVVQILGDSFAFHFVLKPSGVA